MALLVMSISHAYPQDAGDRGAGIAPQEEQIVFRFKPTAEIFIADYFSNKQNLARFSRMIEDSKSDILAGRLVVRVNGYCSSASTSRENLAIAKVRSNHVKSWFIVYNSLKEEHFRTYNAARDWNGMSDVVAVAYLERVNGEEESAKADEQDLLEYIPAVAESDDAAVSAGEDEPSGANQMNVSEPLSDDRSSLKPIGEVQPRFEKQRRADVRPVFSVKTNLYYWSGMMPDFKHYSYLPNISVEWFFADRWSVQASGAYVQHRLNDRKFFGASAYGIEPRYWFKGDGIHNWFYAGVYGELGDFDNQYMHTDDYRTGDHYGVGLSVGAYLPVTQRLGVELGLRGGYISKDIDYYIRQVGGYFRSRGETKDEFDLTGVNVSVSYRFGNKTR